MAATACTYCNRIFHVDDKFMKLRLSGELYCSVKCARADRRLRVAYSDENIRGGNTETELFVWIAKRSGKM